MQIINNDNNVIKILKMFFQLDVQILGKITIS